MYKILFFILSISFSGSSFSQGDFGKDTIYNSSIVITLALDDTVLSQSNLDTGFLIQAKDSSYRIVSFSMTYPCKFENGFGLHHTSFPGQRVLMDTKSPKLCNVGGSDFVAFDKILLERDKQFYYAKAFITYIKD